AFQHACFAGVPASLPAHLDQPTVEIHVLPLQSGDFPGAHACVDCELDVLGEPGGCAVDEGLDFLRGGEAVVVDLHGLVSLVAPYGTNPSLDEATICCPVEEGAGLADLVADGAFFVWPSCCPCPAVA